MPAARTLQRLGGIAVLAVAAVTTPAATAAPGDAAPPATPEQQVLALVNHYRQLAGAAPVVLDDKLSAGCREHAEYMRKNRGTAALEGLRAHHQDPTLPGASPAGAECGANADLFPGVRDLTTAVDGWMAGLYHRRPILAPSLRAIGVGYAALPDGTLMAALRFVDGDVTPAGWPVAYPAADQGDVPLELGGEVPNPAPRGGAGYPLTLEFPPFDAVTGARATLVDAAGAPVPFYLSSPEHPATSFGQYGVICVIPTAPLRPDARYTVSITAAWGTAPARTWSWSFRTVGLRAVDASDEAALVAAIGHPSRVHGVVRYGGAMDRVTTFLMIGDPDLAHHKMVSILLPTTLWQTVGGGAPPGDWTGATVDVTTTPRSAGTTYLNLPITTATQIQLQR